MNTLPITYEFNQQSIRVVTLDGEPWFVGADVCRVLGISNTGNAYQRLSDDQKTNIRRVDVGLSAGRDLKLISESGLYNLTMRSDKPEALKFQDWVTREVLPSIRKTGSYSRAKAASHQELAALGLAQVIPMVA